MRNHRRFVQFGVAGLATTAVLSAALGLTASPASAASVSGYGSGPVGAPQQINVTGAQGCGAMTFTAVYQNSSQQSVPSVFPDANGNATIYWSPNAAGAVTSASIGSTCTPIDLGSANISKVGTLTTIAAPNVAVVGQATMITVNVQSASPSAYSPTGHVTVRDGNGNVVTGFGLTPNGTATSFAYWYWTPPASGSYVFQATYDGDSNANGSTSAQDVVSASPSGNTITLVVPGTLTVGIPTNLKATFVPTTIQGSVGFTFNGAPISASVPIVNGQANFQWTPTVAGAAVLGASYMTNGGASGSTSDKVNIVAGPAQQDVITLTQPGWGTWAPNGQYNLPNGTSTTMTATTLSGSPVVLTETGPCSITNRLTIVVNVGSGQCNIQASSTGGKGYSAVTYGYTVNAIPGTQTAILSAPNSGNLTKGRTYVIEAPGQVDTNAGQNISWKITSGKNSVCKLSYPSDGSVKLKMVNKGTCNIKGTAPGVPGQWNAYSVTRSYKVK